MNTYYTKEQMDGLASLIGTRIKESTTPNRLNASLNGSGYGLLSDQDKGLLAIPAESTDSFLAALNGTNSDNRQYINLGIPVMTALNVEQETQLN